MGRDVGTKPVNTLQDPAATPLDAQRPWLGPRAIHEAAEEVLRAHLVMQADRSDFLRVLFEPGDGDVNALANALCDEAPRACYADGPSAYRAVVLKTFPRVQIALDGALDELRGVIHSVLREGPKAKVQGIPFYLVDAARLAKTYCRTGGQPLLPPRGTPPGGRDLVLTVSHGCPSAALRLPASATFREVARLVSELAYDPDPTHGVMFLIPGEGQHGTHPPRFDFEGITIDDPRMTDPDKPLAEPDTTPIGAYLRSSGHPHGVSQLWMLWDFGSTQAFRIRVADERPHMVGADPWVKRPKVRAIDDAEDGEGG